MSLPTGRGAQRVRSCGRARKRDGSGGQLRRGGSSRNIASIIGVLLRENDTRCGGVMVTWRECRAEEKVCQYNSLGGKREKKRGANSLIEIS
jgi:hypothetical protein